VAKALDVANGARLSSASDPSQVAAMGFKTGALGRLVAVVETYPDLKAERSPKSSDLPPRPSMAKSMVPGIGLGYRI
jgi:hypothetical protein